MWTIQEQIEKKGKQETSVLCKHVKYFPKTDGSGNVEGFGKLPRIVLRIILRNTKGYELKLTAHGDPTDPQFTITHPEKEQAPMIWVGEGKRRRKVYDYFGTPTKVAEKEKYPYRSDFEARCKALFGEEMKEEIMTLFTLKMGYLLAKA